MKSEEKVEVASLYTGGQCLVPIQPLIARDIYFVHVLYLISIQVTISNSHSNKAVGCHKPNELLNRSLYVFPIPISKLDNKGSLTLVKYFII